VVLVWMHNVERRGVVSVAIDAEKVAETAWQSMIVVFYSSLDWCRLCRLRTSEDIYNGAESM